LNHETWGERGNFNVLKKFAKTYIRSFTGAHELIDAVMHTRGHAEAPKVLDAGLETFRARDGAA